jgi:hypothetical protein
MLERRCRGGIAQQFGEFVEGGDFHGAGARELFFHAGNGGGGQEAAIGRPSARDNGV